MTERSKPVKPQSSVRSDMVRSAVRLLATQGVEGTSFKEVLELADAPRGSVYHHFPGGKAELLHAALDLVGDSTLDPLEANRGRPATVILEQFLELWRDQLDRSKFSAGCAVVAVTVTGPDTELQKHAGKIFRTWQAQLASLLHAGGIDEEIADSLATLIISSNEGAILLSRAQATRDAFDSVAQLLRELVASAQRKSD